MVVKVSWPADHEISAGCSFYSADLEPEDFHGWFVKRIGEANDTAWDPKKRLAIWRIKTNGHRAGIYVARDGHPKTDNTVSVLHILQ